MGEEQKDEESLSAISQEISASLTAGVTLLSSGQPKRALAHLNLAVESSSALGVNTPSVDASGMDLSATEKNRQTLSDAYLLQLCAEVYYYRALVLQQLGAFAESVKSYKVSIDLFLWMDAHPHAAAGMVGLAECYQELGDIGNQLRSWESARHLYRETGDVLNEAAVCVGMARTYLGAGQSALCTQSLHESRHLCQRVQDKHSRGEVLAQCGWVYSRMKQFKEALVCFEQALHSLHRDRRAAASILQNIGAIHNQLGQFTEALDYHKQAAKLYSKLHKLSSQSKCLCNLAYAQSQLHDYSNAAKSYQQALAKAHVSSDNHLVFQASEGLGAVHYAMGQHSEASTYFNEAMTALSSIEMDTGLARERVMEKLSRVAEASSMDAGTVATHTHKKQLKEMTQETISSEIQRGKHEKMKRCDSVDADLTAYMISYNGKSSSSDCEENIEAISPPAAPSYVTEGSLALGPKTRELYTTVNVTSDSSKGKTEIVSVTDVHNHPPTTRHTTDTQTNSKICTLL